MRRKKDIRKLHFFKAKNKKKLVFCRTKNFFESFSKLPPKKNLYQRSFTFFFASEFLVLSYVIVRTNLLKTEHNKPTQ